MVEPRRGGVASGREARCEVFPRGVFPWVIARRRRVVVVDSMGPVVPAWKVRASRDEREEGRGR